MRQIAFFILLELSLHAVSAMADGANSQALPSEIRNYRSWTAFPNISLGIMDPALCFIPPKYFEYSSNQSAPKGPHKDKFLSVYFNHAAQNVVGYLRSKHFPVGSIIVKEKRTTQSASIDGIGVMVKRENGFDSDVGDWEFMYLDSTNKLTRGNNAAQSCKSCHMQVKSTDYIYGNYAKAKTK